MNQAAERKLLELSKRSEIDVKLLDDFILDDLCFRIPDGCMNLSSVNTYPCLHIDTMR